MYILSSRSFLTSIGPDDRHRHFVYYIRLRTFEYGWIDDWFESKFQLISDSFGPNAVFVTPSSFLDEDVLDEISHSYLRFVKNERLRTPHLLVTRRPVDLTDQAASQSDFAAIDLGALKEVRDLERLVDLLLQAGLNGEEDMIGKIAEIERSFSEPGRFLTTVNQALELKPRVMGVGFNANVIISYLIERLQRRRSGGGAP